MKKIFIVLLVIFNKMLLSQDLQFSQLIAVPLALNPAFAGNNNCNYRVSAIYRNQWIGSDNINSFQSTNVAFDINLGNNSYDIKNIIGLGFLGSYDKSKNNTFNYYYSMANFAYHMRLGESGQNLLSLGVQAGINGNNINSQSLVFQDQIDIFGNVTQQNTNLANTSNLNPQVNFGTLLTLNPNENTNIYLGSSIFNLVNSKVSYTSNTYYTPKRFNIHAGAYKNINGFLLLPNFYYQYQLVSNFNIGTYIGKIIVNETETSPAVKMYIGSWYKSNDAITLATRLDLYNISFAFSYDIHNANVNIPGSSLGSPEFSINFNGCLSKNSRRTGCPIL